MPAAVAPWAGPAPAQASTSTSSPLRNRWHLTPPVARPLAGNSAYGDTFTLAAAEPGSAPVLPAAVTTTGSVLSALPSGSAATAPNQITVVLGESRTPAIPPAARPCGRTEAAPNRSSCPSLVMNTRS